MINRTPLKLFQTFERGRFLKPLYQDYSFANIAPTIHYLLTGKNLGSQFPGLLAPDCFGGAYPKPKKIVLFFIDSFGFSFWEKYYKRFPIMKRVVKEGTVTPISALFPSTTAASVSTVCLGVLPSRHALYEWNLYIEAYNAVIQTLPFCPIDNRTLDYGLILDYDPKHLLSYKTTIYEELEKQKIKSYMILNSEYFDSSYSKLVSRGSKILPFGDLPEALEKTRQVLQKGEKSYIYFYWDKIDSIAHRLGPGSKEHEGEIEYFWDTFEKFLQDYEKPDNTLFLFAADHGHHAAHKKNTLYLNKEIPELTPNLQTTQGGSVIYPNGSPRDVFLHIKPGKIDASLRLLKKKLAGRAYVISSKNALRQGLLGPPPFGEEFLARLGQIIILPYPGKYVWWYEKDKIENRFLGHHGGLSRDEMLAAFAVL